MLIYSAHLWSRELGRTTYGDGSVRPPPERLITGVLKVETKNECIIGTSRIPGVLLNALRTLHGTHMKTLRLPRELSWPCPYPRGRDIGLPLYESTTLRPNTPAICTRTCPLQHRLWISHPVSKRSQDVKRGRTSMRARNAREVRPRTTPQNHAESQTRKRGSLGLEST